MLGNIRAFVPEKRSARAGVDHPPAHCPTVTGSAFHGRLEPRRDRGGVRDDGADDDGVRAGLHGGGLLGHVEAVEALEDLPVRPMASAEVVIGP